ncbi:MAG: hypothetical protein HC859_01680 [Bacteroidia bacterium]|nr:hypothetical protein [Bacteroidia bacterium]
MNIRSESFLNLVVIALFLALGLNGAFHHEVWLDESHHWLIARDSNTIGELAYHLRYDGHPILWNIILFVITRFTQQVVWMQVVHVCIASAAVAVFLVKAPFSRWIKYLFVAGYYPFYEYSLLSRNYSIIVLLLFVVLSLDGAKSGRASLVKGFCLALLANTHLLGLILCAAYFVSWFYYTYAQKAWSAATVAALALAVTGCVTAVIQIIPPADSPLVTHWPMGSMAGENFRRALAMPVKSFIPFPDITRRDYWNEYLLVDYARPLSAIISVLLLAWPALALSRSRRAVLFFYLTLGAMLLFFFMANIVAARYFGILYVAFIGALWIQYADVVSRPFVRSRRIEMINRRTFHLVLSCILVIHAAAGVVAYALDVMRPFSSSRSLAAYVSQTPPAALVMENCRYASALSYTGSQAYFLQQQQWGSYCQFHQLESPYPQAVLVARLEEFLKQHPEGAWFIHYERLEPSVLAGSHLQFATAFDPCVIDHENFIVYRLILSGSAEN